MSARAFKTKTRKPILPTDANECGDVLGGVILSHIDLAGAYAARELSPGRRFVTVAMKEVVFKQPVLVGDVLRCRTRVLQLGRSSVRVKIVADAIRANRNIKVTEAEATYVAVNEQGRPVAIFPEGKKRDAARPQESPVTARRAVEESAMVVRDCCPAIQFPMQPADMNAMGKVFGGVILDHIDAAGREEARRTCANPRLVTVCMKEVIFKKPVQVGDMLVCWGQVTKIGNTSITVRIEVEAERDGEVLQVTEATVTYVAVDGERRPEPVRLWPGKQRRRD